MENPAKAIAVTVVGGIVLSLTTNIFSLDNRVVALEVNQVNGAKILQEINKSLSDISEDVSELRAEAAVRKALQEELKEELKELKTK